MKCLVLWQFSLYVVLGFFVVFTHSVHAIGTTIGNEQQHSNFNETSRLPTNSTSIQNSAIETVHVPTSSPDSNGQSQKQQHSSMTNSEEDSLEEQLKDDQVALRRMVLILSLVGGLGAVAVITTIVIFTKMRKRKKQRTDQHHHNKSTTDRPHHHHQRGADNGNGSTSYWREATSSAHCDSATTNAPTLFNQPPTSTSPQPSAPPPVSIVMPHCQHRRVITMSSQQQPSSTTPEPSAPTVKELENSNNINNDVPSPCTLCDPQHYHHYHHHSITQEPSGLGTISLPPEFPPPAYTENRPSYTPNTPPLYQGIHPSGSPSQQRRHSQS